MTRINKKIVTFAAITAFFTMGSAAYAIDAVVPASVTITAPTLSLPSPATGMDFGGIINGSTTTIIRLNSSANVASVPTIIGTGDAALDGNGNSGTITVQSNIDATLDVTIGSVIGSGTGLTNGSLDNFDSTNQLSMATSAVDSNTADTLAVVAGVPSVLHVGSQISVANDQTADSYGANVTISLNY